MTVFNPARRNRHLGTSARGHGQSNCFKPPASQRDRVFQETVLPGFKIERHSVHEVERTFIVDAFSPTWQTVCDVPSILQILHALPVGDLEGMNGFLLKQPTHKENIANPSWGRMRYMASVGSSQTPSLYEGPLIVLNAQPLEMKIKWEKSLNPSSLLELERLRSDGHQITEKRSHFLISSPAEAIRNTQLHRTLLHELGHWVDYLEKVERPNERGYDDAFSERYFARPQREREEFAHRYAANMRAMLNEKWRS